MTKRGKRLKKVIDLTPLNTEQKQAFDSLVEYIQDGSDDSIYVLKGWAGTGKTFCISLLVKYVLESLYPNKAFYKIAVTGPTNKSVRVIKQATGIRNQRVSFQTIHKLLGLKEKITLDGKQEFVAEGDFKPSISAVRLLIIDEVSMLNDELFHKILNYRGKLKVICMGDPAQIPPVGRPDCIPFREELADAYRIKTISLKRVMRQNLGNPIIDASVTIRKNLGSPKSLVDPITSLSESGEGIEFLNLNNPETRQRFSGILEGYFKTEEFKKDSEYSKVIAWRNKTVDSMNALIRKVIYGEEALTSKILPGEKLIANTPIVQDGSILLNTNSEFTVQSYEIKEDLIKESMFQIKLKHYEAKVGYYDDDDERCIAYIDILHESSQDDFKKAAELLKQDAISKRGKDKSWIKYYDFLRLYADVNYSYSITCHKAQGSTYGITFVLEDDIDVNLDVVERNRIKYTAYTRPKKKLYVLKRL